MKHEAKENLRHDQGLVDGIPLINFVFEKSEWLVENR